MGDVVRIAPAWLVRPKPETPVGPAEVVHFLDQARAIRLAGCRLSSRGDSTGARSAFARADRYEIAYFQARHRAMAIAQSKSVGAQKRWEYWSQEGAG